LVVDDCDAGEELWVASDRIEHVSIIEPEEAHLDQYDTLYEGESAVLKEFFWGEGVRDNIGWFVVASQRVGGAKFWPDVDMGVDPSDFIGRRRWGAWFWTRL
jgi:hypothetical protein